MLPFGHCSLRVLLESSSRMESFASTDSGTMPRSPSVFRRFMVYLTRHTICKWKGQTVKSPLFSPATHLTKPLLTSWAQRFCSQCKLFLNSLLGVFRCHQALRHCSSALMREMRDFVESFEDALQQYVSSVDDLDR